MEVNTVRLRGACDMFLRMCQKQTPTISREGVASLYIQSPATLVCAARYHGARRWVREVIDESFTGALVTPWTEMKDVDETLDAALASVLPSHELARSRSRPFLDRLKGLSSHLDSVVILLNGFERVSDPRWNNELQRLNANKKEFGHVRVIVRSTLDESTLVQGVLDEDSYYWAGQLPLTAIGEFSSNEVKRLAETFGPKAVAIPPVTYSDFGGHPYLLNLLFAHIRDGGTVQHARVNAWTVLHPFLVRLYDAMVDTPGAFDFVNESDGEKNGVAAGKVTPELQAFLVEWGLMAWSSENRRYELRIRAAREALSHR